MNLHREEQIKELITGFRFIKKHLSQHHNGLTHTEWVILFMIGEQGDISVKKIAETLGTTSSATTQIVRDLSQAWYIDREANPSDKREILLTLTKQGKDKLHILHKEKMQAYNTLLAPLDDAELAEFIRLAKKITS